MVLAFQQNYVLMLMQPSTALIVKESTAWLMETQLGTTIQSTIMIFIPGKVQIQGKMEIVSTIYHSF